GPAQPRWAGGGVPRPRAPGLARGPDDGGLPRLHRLPAAPPRAVPRPAAVPADRGADGDRRVTDPKACAFYRDVLERMRADGVRFMVGGAYALQHHTGVCRHTKDVDVFIHPAERDRALAVLADAGYETE